MGCWLLLLVREIPASITFYPLGISAHLYSWNPASITGHICITIPFSLCSISLKLVFHLSQLLPMNEMPITTGFIPAIFRFIFRARGFCLFRIFPRKSRLNELFAREERNIFRPFKLKRDALLCSLLRHNWKCALLCRISRKEVEFEIPAVFRGLCLNMFEIS